MASPIGYQLSLEDSDFVDAWIRCFSASARSKKLKDNKEKGGENEITDLFLATAGCEAIMKVSTMAYPTNLENLTFEKISQIIRRNMRPKKRLVVAKRTKFMLLKQEIDEPIIKYLHRLRNASRYCEFEKLGQTIEEDLIQLRLIEGMCNASHRYKIMEQLQIGNMSLNTCIDFIQQQELIQKYNHHKSQPSEQIFADMYMLKKIRKCAYCGHEHGKNKIKIKKEKFSAFGKTCTNCLKRTIFKQYANSKRKPLKELKKMKPIWKSSH